MARIPYKNLLKWALWLIALHSICYGIALIIFPSSFFSFFGFNLPEKFFADQGGVFHLIISTVYILAARDLPRAGNFIFITCLTKFSAALFLFSYYIFASQIWMVLLSGIVDLSMGLAVLFLYKAYRNAETNQLS